LAWRAIVARSTAESRIRSPCSISEGVGPAERIRDRMQAWKESPVSTNLAGSRDPVALQALADAL